MTYGIASSFSLEQLVGKRVVALRDFNGIPAGTVGLVTEMYDGPHIIRRPNGIPANRGIMVLWTTTSGRDVSDGFGRDQDFDETAYLAVIE